MLTTEDGDAVPELHLTAERVLGRLVAVYGPSGSGKTRIVKAILDKLRGHADQIILVCPTSGSNQAYVDYVPPQLTHAVMDAPDPKRPSKQLGGSKGVEAFLERIWQRQEVMARIDTLTHDRKILEGLCARLPPAASRAAVRDLEKVAALDAKVEGLARKHPQAAERLRAYGETLPRLGVEILRRHISRGRRTLAKAPDLTPNERDALEHLDANAHLVLVLDDCAADLKAIDSKPIIRKLFYQGRHMKITSIITFQDDSDIKPNLRKNAHVSIFCSENVCTVNYERSTSGCSKAEKRRALQAAAAVFAQKHRVFVNVHGDTQFYHYTAPPPENQMFCSPAVLELCRSVALTEEGGCRANPYYRDFAPP